MSQYKILKRNRYFEVLGYLNNENRMNDKVGMVIDIDLTQLQFARNKLFIQTGLKPTYTTFLVKAIAQTLVEQKHANRFTLDLPFYKRVVQLEGSADISVAVEKDRPEIEQAVYVATVRDADKKSLTEIAAELKFFAGASSETDERWKAMQMVVEKIPFLWLSKLLISLPKYLPSLWVKHRGGAAVVSSPSKYGVDTMIGSWPWPLGFSFGLVKDRVIAVNGQAEVRQTMSVSFSFDRRLMGGAPAARFFRAVCDKLENIHVDEVDLHDKPWKMKEEKFPISTSN